MLCSTAMTGAGRSCLLRAATASRRPASIPCSTSLGGRVSAAAAVSIRARIRAVVTAPLLRILDSGNPAYDDARAGFHAGFLKCSLTRAAGSGRAWERSGAGAAPWGLSSRLRLPAAAGPLDGRSTWAHRVVVSPPRQAIGSVPVAPSTPAGWWRSCRRRGPVDQFLRSQTLEQSAGRTRRTRPGHRRGGPVRSREVQGPGGRPSGGLSARWEVIGTAPVNAYQPRPSS